LRNTIAKYIFAFLLAQRDYQQSSLAEENQLIKITLEHSMESIEDCKSMHFYSKEERIDLAELLILIFGIDWTWTRRKESKEE
jgi:hypothetical protein